MLSTPFTLVQRFKEPGAAGISESCGGVFRGCIAQAFQLAPYITSYKLIPSHLLADPPVYISRIDSLVQSFF
jgi:hypothetical protein